MTLFGLSTCINTVTLDTKLLTTYNAGNLVRMMYLDLPLFTKA